MIVAGGNGSSHEIRTRTYACIIDPWANVTASIDPEPDDDFNTVVADLNPEKYIARRTNEDYPLKKRRPEMYKYIVSDYF